MFVYQLISVKVDTIFWSCLIRQQNAYCIVSEKFALQRQHQLQLTTKVSLSEKILREFIMNFLSILLKTEYFENCLCNSVEIN